MMCEAAAAADSVRDARMGRRSPQGDRRRGGEALRFVGVLLCGGLALAAGWGCGREQGERPAAGDGAAPPDAAPPARVTLSFDADPVRLVREAEAGEVVAPMAVFEDASASGGRYVMTPEPPDSISETKGGQVALTFEVAKPAAYAVWLRVNWPSSCDNSFDVMVNDLPPIEVSTNTYKEWIWVQAGRDPVPLDAGPALVRVRSREDGSKLDQVLLVEIEEGKTPYVPVRVERGE